MSGHWEARALCAEVDPELFFPEGQGSRPSDAKSVCRHCEVRAECLGYAMEHPELEGVWGGLTQRERGWQRQPLSRARQPHGTLAAYRRHLRHGEPACESCLQAGQRAWNDRASDANEKRRATGRVA